jgi:hypothetical protein
MITRRGMVAAGTGFALMAGMPMPSGDSAALADASPNPMGSARDFGAVGDGRADDTAAIEKAFQAALAGRDARVIIIPPGLYRITRPIKLTTGNRGNGNITHRAGIIAHGARLLSAISSREPVLQIESRAIFRYFLIEGLQIQGNGREGHGLSIVCETRGNYFYNFCLRDLVIESCGGDGLSLVGNIFEGQIINCYFRDNKHNGTTLSHGNENTVLSAVHVYGSIFGGNGHYGVEMLRGAMDVGFNGCYFLLNNSYGLSASSGCTLLSHCGFENNHSGANGYAEDHAGIMLKGFGTLVGCTAYSIYNQSHLIRAYATNKVTLVGCTGSGGGKAKQARLGAFSSAGDQASITLIGCTGGVDREGNVPILQPVAVDGSHPQFGELWNSPNPMQLGKHTLWIDGQGRLRMIDGRPRHDEDGRVIGT